MFSGGKTARLERKIMGVLTARWSRRETKACSETVYLQHVHKIRSDRGADMNMMMKIEILKNKIMQHNILLDVELG